jgi:hypothetical protein
MRQKKFIATNCYMEDDNPLGFFGDDLIDASPVKYKSQQSSGEPTLEEWVCRQKRTTLLNWINKNMQEKIQKFLSYPWNNPSERVKQHITTLLSEEKIHGSPIYALCAQGDPSDGQLLRIFLTYLEGADLGNYDFCYNLSTFFLLLSCCRSRLPAIFYFSSHSILKVD